MTTRKYRTWTAHDMQFIIDNIDNLTTDEIAEKLHRTKTSLLSQMRRHKISPRKSLTKKVDDIVKEYHVQLSKGESA